MKNPLQFSKLFINAILLLCTPALIAYPQSDVLTAIHPSSSFANKGDLMRQLLTEDGLLSYDAVIRLLNEIENGDIEEAALLPADWDKIKNFLAFLAQQSIMPDDPQEKTEAIERDIQELLHSDEDSTEFSETAYFPYQMGEYTIVPAVFYGQTNTDIVLCKSWISKQWKHCKKFIKNHKKEVIIGTVLVVAAVAVVITAVAATTAAAAGTAAVAAAEKSKEPARKESKESVSESVLQPTVENQVATLKGTVLDNNLLPLISGNQNQQEDARIVGAHLAHDTVHSISTLPYLYGESGNYEQINMERHGKIDQAFSTEEARYYVNKEMDPVPSTILQANIYQSKGEQLLKSGQYDLAVCDFEKAMEFNPYNHELYLAKAYSLFEQGSYDQALGSYRTYVSKEPISSQTSISLGETFDVSMSFAKGFKNGAVESGHQLVSFASDVVCHPIDTACGVYESFSTLAKLAHNKDWRRMSMALVPEVHQLVHEWERLPVKEKSERIGYITGKYGADIFMPGVAAKLISRGAKGAKEMYTVMKNLETAQRTFALEGAFFHSVEEFNEFTKAATQLEKITSPTTSQMGMIEQGLSSVTKGVTIDIGKFSEAGKLMDRGGLTKAGRGLAKHGGREGSVFPKPVGNPAQVNAHGQQVLESILNHPEKKIISDKLERFGEVVDIYAPNIGGVRYTIDGKFIGFLEPR